MNNDEQPRAYTIDECRDMFLDQIRALADYWATVEQPDGPRTTRERLDGLAFSVLVMLDGCSSLPGFQVIPAPHPSDREFCASEGENWWPDDQDIGGGLHDQWVRRR
jgi:hypothetical protein